MSSFSDTDSEKDERNTENYLPLEAVAGVSAHVSPERDGRKRKHTMAAQCHSH